MFNKLSINHQAIGVSPWLWEPPVVSKASASWNQVEHLALMHHLMGHLARGRAEEIGRKEAKEEGRKERKEKNKIKIPWKKTMKTEERKKEKNGRKEKNRKVKQRTERKSEPGGSWNLISICFKPECLEEQPLPQGNRSFQQVSQLPPNPQCLEWFPHFYNLLYSYWQICRHSWFNASRWVCLGSPKTIEVMMFPMKRLLKPFQTCSYQNTATSPWNHHYATILRGNTGLAFPILF